MKLKTAVLIALICIMLHLIFNLVLLLQPVQAYSIIISRLIHLFNTLLFDGGIALFLWVLYYNQKQSINTFVGTTSERNKKAILLTLLFVTLILDVIALLPYGSFVLIQEKTRMFYWAWLFAFILPSVAILLTLYWKPRNKILSGFILFLSIISLIFAGLWFILFFISQMGP